MEQRNGKTYVSDADSPSQKTGAPIAFDIGKLDDRLVKEVLVPILRANAIRDTVDEWNRLGETKVEYGKRKAEYERSAKAMFREYRRRAASSKGVDFSEFPKLTLPKVPADLAKDADIQRLCLSYKRQAGAMRAKLAKNVPVSKNRSGASQGGSVTRGDIGHDVPTRNRGRQR